jgi:tetratricopeptide (TPR) repeat protein
MIIATLGLSAVIVAGMYVNRSKPDVSGQAAIADEPTNESNQPQPVQPRPPTTEAAAAAQPGRPGPVGTSPAPEISAAPSPAMDSKLLFDQTIETLVSPQTDYEQRQRIWKQLKNAGKLDEAITQLEQRAAANPRSAEDVTALGEGYYKKAGDTDDVRDKAILAMNADQTLEAALNLDASNWDARFTKAAGMSYWPAELNEGQKVVQEFVTLIQQQEAQSPQPQFARTYLRLGEQYQKAGNADYAAQVWQRGAALFPDDSGLKEKLASGRQSTAVR